MHDARLFLLATRGFFFSILVFGFLFVWQEGVHAAGSLTLSPSTDTGSQFTVQILVDTGGDATIETDVSLEFDPAIVNVESVEFGTLYPENISNIDNATGRVSTFSYFSGTNPGDSFTGTGVLATVNMTGVANGTADVTIACTPLATNDSNIILQGSPEDILDCNSIVNGSYTVTGASSSVSPTPTPSIQLEVSPTATLTPSPSPTATPTPVAIGSSETSPTPTPVQTLPEAGASTATLVLSVVGASLIMGSLLLFIW